MKPPQKSTGKSFGLQIYMIKKKHKSTVEMAPLHPLIHLQQTMGNQAVGRLIQAKMRVGQQGDKYEQEADRVANQVMCISTSQVQRFIENKQIFPQPMEEEDELEMQTNEEVEEELIMHSEEEGNKTIQTKESNTISSLISPKIESNIDTLLVGGQPLPISARAFFEPRFRHDFSKVRIHADTRAAETSDLLNAKAFTIGNNIVFGSNQYAPDTSKGKKLLAHELTHTLQQDGRKKIQRAEEESAEEKELKTKVKNLVNKKFGGDYKKAFNYYDKDHDNSINSKELEMLLKDADVGNWATRGSWVDAIIEKLDTNKNKKIEWIEFQNVIKKKS